MNAKTVQIDLKSTAMYYGTTYDTLENRKCDAWHLLVDLSSLARITLCDRFP